MSRLLHCMIFARRPRRWIAALALVNYLTLCCGISLPAATLGPIDGPAFPCQSHRCGCATAEKCWRDCCCFTMAEKLAWAKSHGVTPPAYVVAEVEAPALTPPSKKCCCSSANPAASARGARECGSTVEGKKSEVGGQRSEVCGRQQGTQYSVPSTPLSALRSPLSPSPNSEPSTPNSLSFLDALRCRGQSSNWLNLTWSVTPDSPLDLIGLELVASPLSDVRLPSLPTLSFDPPVPPPRAA